MDVTSRVRVDAAGLVSSPLVGMGLEPLGPHACVRPLPAAAIGLFERLLVLLLSVSKRTVRGMLCGGVPISLLGAGNDVRTMELDDRKMQIEHRTEKAMRKERRMSIHLACASQKAFT